ncbi:hypothetical protein NXS19_001244 [Fusarium pseudograminearum]|nr:hypothetical protein NXS19_001244 [Fusarium pseudograminearum]
MGFTDLLSETGAHVLNSWLSTRSYIVGQSASQADVAAFKALSGPPPARATPTPLDGTSTSPATRASSPPFPVMLLLPTAPTVPAPPR